MSLFFNLLYCVVVFMLELLGLLFVVLDVLFCCLGLGCWFGWF